MTKCPHCGKDIERSEGRGRTIRAAVLALFTDIVGLTTFAVMIVMTFKQPPSVHRDMGLLLFSALAAFCIGVMVYLSLEIEAMINTA